MCFLGTIHISEHHKTSKNIISGELCMSKKKPFNDLLDLFKQFSGNGTANGVGDTVKRGARPDRSTNISELLSWLTFWQKSSPPKLDETHICIFVSSYEGHDQQSNLKEFIDRAGQGKVPVGKLCKDRGVGLRVLEMAPEIPHVVTDKWPENHCMAAVGFGMEATAAGGNILGLAGLAPGDEKYCAAFCHFLMQNFTNINQGNVEKDKNDSSALDVLHSMKNNTGREVAAMVGAMIAARSRNMPVLAEGWSAIAALCVLMAIDPTSIDHIRVASVESADQLPVIEALGFHAIVGGIVDLGPGCGVALAHSIVTSLTYTAD